MKLPIFTVVALLSAFPVAAQQQSMTITKTAQEVQDTITLLGRGCRAADDATWMAACGIAITQASKELDAWKRAAVTVPDVKPPESPKP